MVRHAVKTVFILSRAVGGWNKSATTTRSVVAAVMVVAAPLCIHAPNQARFAALAQPHLFLVVLSRFHIFTGDSSSTLSQYAHSLWSPRGIQLVFVDAVQLHLVSGADVAHLLPREIIPNAQRSEQERQKHREADHDAEIVDLHGLC